MGIRSAFVPASKLEEKTFKAIVLPAAILLLTDFITAFLIYILFTYFFDHVFGLRLDRTHIAWIFVWIIGRSYLGFYPGYGRSPQNELRIHVTSTIQVGVLHCMLAPLLNSSINFVPLIILIWTSILIIVLPLRYSIRTLMIRMHIFGSEISIIGAGSTARVIIDYLIKHPSYGFIPIAAYDDNVNLKGKELNGVPILGSISLALAEPKTKHALILIPSARAEAQQYIVNNVYRKFSITWIVPDLIGVPNQAIVTHNIGSVATLEIRNNLKSLNARFVKRMIDFVGSILGGIVVLPILLIIAILIKIDSPGPVFYRASRIGKEGKSFDCYKFRSMYVDAEDKLIELLESDQNLKKEYETYHKMKDDPRITNIGRILRKFSLDELPQILNVLIGEMSLVGPRPYLFREKEKMGSAADLITQVRPGMTGYWQVSGRSASTFDERIDMDKFYVTNWTPWLDIIILVQTIEVVVKSKSAY